MARVRPQRLTGFDAGFLYQETPTAHMHTLKVAVLDPAGVPGGYSFDLVREVLLAHLHLLPPFTRRMVPVPLALHHPVWVEDPALDLDNHLVRAALPAPGGPREFGALISQVAGRPLDRSHPLWEIHMVEGLERGRIGCIAKVHHAVADGVSSAELLMSVMGAGTGPTEYGPDGQTTSAPGMCRSPGPAPPSSQLLADAVVDLVRLLLTLPGQVRRSAAALRAMRARAAASDVRAPRVFSGPKTSFNRALTADRIFAFTSLDLAQAKEVKARHDTTLNDVVMAACAGAVRAYMERRGDAVDQPLVVGVPMSTRTAEQRGTYGNRVSNMFASLPVHLADPVDRLHATSRVNRVARAQAEALGPDSFEALSEYSPPLAVTLYARTVGRLKLADRGRPPINLVISNVPGPATPLSIAGAELEAIYSVGPILEGIGLNITMWSYRGQMNFGLLSCRSIMPDLWDLAGDIHNAMDELAKAPA
jgi:diacylglycerol O-acyltransferase